MPREVDIDRCRRPGRKQLVLDRPDPAADVEQRRAADALRHDRVEQPLGMTRRPVAAVVLELPPGVAIVEEGVIVDATAARLRHGAIIDEFAGPAASYRAD